MTGMVRDECGVTTKGECGMVRHDRGIELGQTWDELGMSGWVWSQMEASTRALRAPTALLSKARAIKTTGGQGGKEETIHEWESNVFPLMVFRAALSGW
jgi:hypothetical protein